MYVCKYIEKYSMQIGKFLVNFKELPRYIKVSSIYFSCIFGYNVCGSYIDSKNHLEKYREGKLKDLIYSDYDIDNIKTDWDAVKYGANVNFFDRFLNSLIWPITTIDNMVPCIVLALNPSKKND